jgi:chloride channel 2
MAEEAKVPIQNIKPRSNILLTDFMTQMDEVTTSTFLISNEHEGPVNKVTSKLQCLHLTVWVGLFITAAFTSLVAFTVDVLAQRISMGRKELVALVGDYWLGWPVWVVTALVFSWIAASPGMYICPEADGSGIPEMKAIMTGYDMPNFLSWKALFSKWIGLTAGSGAGLSIGREGPYVHIAAICADRVLNSLKFLSKLKDSTTFRNQIYQASIAAGVSATFGTPIGGVIFSIEISCTHFHVTGLWRGAFCGIITTVISGLLINIGLSETINRTDFPELYVTKDIHYFILLGIVSGLVGVYFVYLAKTLIGWRARRVVPWLHPRYRYITFITIIISTCVYFIPFLHFSDKKTFNQMISTDSLPEEWEDDFAPLTVLSYIIVKPIFTAMSVSCQIPSGVFTPNFVAGSTVGRLVGYLSEAMGGSVSPGVYAAVGAAATIAAVTHTLSGALIVFELTGQIHYIVPMFTSTVIAYAIGSWLTPSIFDIIIVMRQIPFLPAFKPAKFYEYKAIEIAEKSFVYIQEDCKLKDIQEARKYEKAFVRFPVVNADRKLLADVSVIDILNYLQACYNVDFQRFSPEVRTYILKALKNPTEDLAVPENIEKEFLEFWETKVDFKSPVLHISKSPTFVPLNTSLAKIHFLFLLLGLSQIYITDRGKLEGTINRETFWSAKK